MTIESRLAELKSEFEKGQAELSKLEERRTEIHSTMLRISGAIQVLEEMKQHPQNEAA